MLGNQVVGCVSIAAVVSILNLTVPHETWAAQPEVVTNTIGMKLVGIPAGQFMMGAEEDRADTLNKFPYWDPRHKVRITKPFYMGQYEVTLGEFLKFYNDSKYKIDAERDGEPSWGFEDGKLVESNRFRPWDPIGWKIEMDHPVIYVSWNDAVAFCEWLSKKEGKKYRLPTEAEWEYSCRAGTNSRYYFGDDPEELIHFANGADADRKTIMPTDASFPFLSGHDGYPWTAPVGKFRPNAFGLYDMHGNVWEWCSDKFDENYYKHSPEDDPQGPGTGSSYVLRGGAYHDTPDPLRCAYRINDPPSHRSFSSSFRVVRDR